MFVDAIHVAQKGKIRVVERDRNGNRHLVDFDAEYLFYYSHPSGTHRSIFGDPVKKYTTNDNRKFRKELGKFKSTTDKHGKPKYKIFESDGNPIFRCLENNYKGVDAPVLHIGFFDIETGFCQDRGFAPVTDPFNPVTAITVYLTHVERNITLVLKPPLMSVDEAEAICSKFEDTVLFDDERELLKTFIAIIDDVDCLSGWNSETFDIPYLVNRITLLLGSDATRDLCLWGEKPRKRMIMKFGKEHESYDLVGRTHLDYLALYQKHTPQQQHSYRLDFIGEIEVKENKVPYEGTLDELYNNDFHKFIEYSRQDVLLLVKIDKKKRYIELANQVAHVNCVLLKTTMGSVALVEQAIMLDMHEKGVVAPDKKISYDDEPVDDSDDEEEGRTPVVGAYVAKPKMGLHDHVACVDINSLYPSAIRALNISPETIVGQIRPDQTMALVEQRIAEGTPRAEAWDGIFETLELKAVFERSGQPVTVDFEDGTTKTMSARELQAYIYNPRNQLCVSANGTIFKTSQKGIIPELLAKWYAERKVLQSLKKEFNELADGKYELSTDLAQEVSQLLV